MAKITLFGIGWTDVLQEAKVVSVKYRKTSDLDIDENYQIVSTNTLADIDGSFFIPVVIDGLDINESYTIRVTSSCGGYYKDQVYDSNNPDTAGFSIGFSTGFNS
jgi:hypothetical protein